VDVLKRGIKEALVADRLPEPFDLENTMAPENHIITSTCRADEVRCHCGQLVARIVREGLELKCKRCRRLFVIPFPSIGGWSTHQNYQN